MSIYSFDYPLMQMLCRELEEKIIGYQVIDCLSQNTQSFSLVFSKNSHFESLFFCFKHPFIRFHLTQKNPGSSLSFPHPLLSFLKESFLIKAELLQQDRILQLTFQNSHQTVLFIAEFFSKHPNYHLMQPDGKILFSLHPFTHPHYQLPSFRPFRGSSNLTWHSHEEVEQAYLTLEKQAFFSQEKQELCSQLNKKLKKLERQEQETLKNLAKCKQWKQVQHEGELIKFHFQQIKKGMSTLGVHDWLNDQVYLLNLDPTKTAKEEMALRFQQAKKLKAGFVPLEAYLKKIQYKTEQIQEQLLQLESFTLLSEIISFKKLLNPLSNKNSKNLISSSSIPYREYQSAEGLKIWVGKNAKANEYLTFQLANGRDFWMHAQGYAGSHVIIRVQKNQLPNVETLQDAMLLALYYSKAREQKEGEICFTQKKFVSRLGKKKGTVQISKHQTKWIRFDPLRYEAIKERLSQ